MAIYPDKKNGELTGRFRVDLQRTYEGQKERYRARHDSLQEAQDDEKRVKALWSAGAVEVSPGTAQAAQSTSGLVSLAEGMAMAKGTLWAGNSTETTCWQRMDHIADIIGPSIPLNHIKPLVLDRLVLELEKRGKAKGTINRYLSNLRTFLEWTGLRELHTLVLKKGTMPWQKEPEGRIRWISPEEEQGAYEYLEGREAPEAHAVRDLIEIALETGCRRDELLTAELGQINGTRLHLWETKTDTPRTIPMTPRTTSLLTNLIKTGTMPTRRGLRSWWGRIKDHLGLSDDKQFVFHVCRHTRATRMVDAGINVFIIKEWMGHKRIETTLRYAHVRPENLELALVKVGDHMAAKGQEPQISAVPDVPLSVPHGGGIAEKQAARG